ncbi:MAG: DUF421 domain-containing protein [Thermomicrobiales bacterium]|nr:DUF421 domain-containing protein [Thermomicrobiales bacterium]
MGMGPIDWGAVFALDKSVLELFVRASTMYLVVFVILRAVLRRASGALATFDFVFVLLVAIGAESAMIGEQTSIGSGLVMVGTLAFWNYLLNALSFHVPFIERLITPPPLQVIRDGRMLPHNMRHEFLTRAELEGHLRLRGIDDVAKVKNAYIEADGTISVIPYER